MNLTEFRNWALAQGSVAKFDDGQFRGECVSLVNQYCHRVLGVPAGAWGNAADWATNANVAQYFSKVSTVQAGDILVYPNKAVPYGHIAIALNQSQMLDQNGDNGRRVAVRGIWANPVILRRKGTGGTVSRIPDQDNFYWRYNKAMLSIRGRNMPRTEFRKNFVGRTHLQMLETMLDNREADRATEAQQWALKNRAAVEKQIADLKKALENEKSKPPKEVIKEVEKIVEKEVIKEVKVGEEEAVRGFFERLLDLVFRR